jgi:hypothetical protein
MSLQSLILQMHLFNSLQTLKTALFRVITQWGFPLLAAENPEQCGSQLLCSRSLRSLLQTFFNVSGGGEGGVVHVENMTSCTKDYGWVIPIYSVNKNVFVQPHTYHTGTKLVEDRVLYTKVGNSTHWNSLISIYILLTVGSVSGKVFTNRAASDYMMILQ